MTSNLRSKRKSNFLRALLFWIAIGFSGEVFSQELFNSYISVNGVSFDEPVWVEYYGEQAIGNNVQLLPLLELFSEVLSKEVLLRIQTNLDSEGRLTFLRLNELGVKTTLDLNSLDLTLEVKVEDKKLTEFLVSGRVDKNGVKAYVRPSFLSGYINLRGAGEFTGTNRTDVLVNKYRDSTSLTAEAVLNVGGLVFESQYLYSDKLSSDLSPGVTLDRWSRLYSRIVFDDVERAVRYSLGDVNHGTRGFQESIQGMGVSFRKEFSIKPRSFGGAFKKYKFFLETDSTVEIFINGNLVRKKIMPQGPVILSEFPFSAGENEVSIRITDAVGEVRSLDFSDISDSRLLAVGAVDYSFNLFYPRKNDVLDVHLDESYLTDSLMFTGFFHMGAYEGLVLGADLQYSKDRALLGLESLYAGREGVLKLNLAGSTDTLIEENGFALRLEHENLFFKKGALSDFRLFTSVEYKTDSFSEFQTGVTHSKYRLRISVGQNFRNSIRASLGAVKEWFYSERENRTYLTSSFGWSLRKNLDFSSNVRVNLQDGDDSLVLLSLNWRAAENNQQLTSTYNPIDNIATAELVSFPWEGKQNFRTYVGGEVNKFSKRVLAGFDYFNQRFELRASHISSRVNSGGGDNTSRVNLGVGLAFSGTSLALTKPVENAFALISMKGRPMGYSVAINKGLHSQRGEINNWGPASITNLAPYYTDRITLDISTLPYGYTLGEESFRFKSTYRSGVKIRVFVEGEVSIAGRVVFNNGEPAEYISGTLYEVEDGQRGKSIQQIFTGGDGYFSIEKVEQKQYILSLEVDDEVFKDVLISVGKSVGVFELKQDVVLTR